MKGGTIRRIANNFKRLLGRPVTTHYKDPVITDPRDRRKKRGSSHSKAVTSSTASSLRVCVPGTIQYHDKLVKHFGRRQAEKYRRLIQSNCLDQLPSDEDFAANPPWAFLSTGTG